MCRGQSIVKGKLHELKLPCVKDAADLRSVTTR
ncbi:MAG: hypothetical protein ACI9UA_005947 [Pseudoalteromonas tetraodonis]|jgi:hypothetical protein